MADPFSVVSAIAALVQAWQGALNAAAGAPTSREHAGILRDYSFSMRILEDCIRDINTAGEELLTPTIVDATIHCMELGRELASRQEKIIGPSTRKRIAHVLAPWAQLQTLYKEFRSSVILIHDLTQGLLLQKLQHDQEKLLMRSFEHERLTRMLMDECMRKKPRFSSRNHGDVESILSRASSFTVSQESAAKEVVVESTAQGIHFDNNPSLVIGTVTVVHGSKPRFLPVRAKYDTGADANFIPSAFVETHGLSSLLEELTDGNPEDNVFIGLNNEEYHIRHTITLQWCASTMHHVRTTKFHVADDLPYDMLLGDPFIQENRIFDPQRMALPLRRKYRNSAQRTEEERLKAENEVKEAEELQRTRLEDKRQRDLMREAKKLAKSQTSASSMSLTSSSNLGLDTTMSMTTVSSGNPLDSPESSRQQSLRGQDLLPTAQYKHAAMAGATLGQMPPRADD